MKKSCMLSALLITALPSTSFANELPDIKEGMWKVESTVDGKPEGTSKHCLDKETTKKMIESGTKMMAQACSPVVITKDGDSYNTTVTCNLGMSKMTSKTSMTGDFKTNYTTVSNTSFNPPMMGMGNSAAKGVATYLGDCEAGMKPGDVIMPDGSKMNMNEMMESMPDLSNLQNLQGNGSGADMGELMKMLPPMEELQKMMPKGQ